MAFSFSLGGLLGGSDRELAATKYAGRTSATGGRRSRERNTIGAGTPGSLTDGHGPRG